MRSLVSRTSIFPALAFSLSLKLPCPQKRLGTVPSNRLNVSYLFSCRRVTNITTRVVHDAADATRCSQKERKCIFKVRWSGECDNLSPPGERKPCYVCLFLGEGGISLAARLPRSQMDVAKCDLIS